MTAEIIDGRKIAHALKAEVSEEVADLRARGVRCGLATVLVGDDYSSRAYERRITRIAGELDVAHEQVDLPGTTTQDEVLDVVGRLNTDAAVSGILVLRPLPPQIDEVDVFRALAPEKDIESVHPENAGLLALGTPRFVPSTAASIFYLLGSWLDGVGEDRASFYHRSLIVVVGRSNNVGKPAISLAYERQASVMSVDEWASKEGRLGWHTRQADVLVVAAGVAGLIKAEHVRSGRSSSTSASTRSTIRRRARSAWSATWPSTRSAPAFGPSPPFPAVSGPSPMCGSYATRSLPHVPQRVVESDLPHPRPGKDRRERPNAVTSNPVLRVRGDALVPRPARHRLRGLQVPRGAPVQHRREPSVQGP